jgi:hypothetical protein
MTGADMALILGAFTALNVAAWGVLVKFALAARSEATSAKNLAADVNRAVNNRPSGEPTLYELVREIKTVVESHGADMAVIRYRLTEIEKKTPAKENQ